MQPVRNELEKPCVGGLCLREEVSAWRMALLASSLLRSPKGPAWGSPRTTDQVQCSPAAQSPSHQELELQQQSLTLANSLISSPEETLQSHPSTLIWERFSFL